jgi:hypothetical protein
VNTYLAQFKRGFRYTFIYQLRDGEGGEDTFGVFDRQSRQKSAATYIHNLTTILADKIQCADGFGQAAGGLNYTISPMPDTVHDLLLKKCNGDYALIVWGEKRSSSESVKVYLGRPHSNVNVYDVTVGAAPVQMLRDVEEVPLTLIDHALIVEVHH